MASQRWYQSKTSSSLAYLASEVFIASQLNHPNIVRINDCVFSGHNVALMMDYVPGKCLFDVIAKLYDVGFYRETRLSILEQYAGMLFYPVLRALSYMHENGVSHRDLKPENIMLSFDGDVKLSKLEIILMSLS